MAADTLFIRAATRDDLPALLALYADDIFGQAREAATLDEAYLSAFKTIDADPNHVLAVGVLDGEVGGTLLLSFLPGLARHGAWRAQIEAMRVAGHLRGRGLGSQLLDWVIVEARRRGCGLVQLTSDRERTDAHRFYERARFVASHVGFKMNLEG